MKSALKILVIIWSCVSVLSLGGLLYLLPTYGIVGAFAAGFGTPRNPQLERWFHLSEMGLSRHSYDCIAVANTGAGRQLIDFTKGQIVYMQGDAANSLFVIQKGRVKLSSKSPAGEEAILDILSEADFVGKDSLSGVSIRTASASALTDSCLLRITKEVMLGALKRQVKLGQYVLDVCVKPHCSLPSRI